MEAVPDDLLKLILPRVDSPLCLIRAASTCKLWRRIITGDGILCHFLSLHTAPVAGVYYNSQSCSDLQPPDIVPSPSAGTINGRHFSLDFLPDGNIRPWVWRIRDSRGSLLLLDHLNEEGSTRYQAGDDVVICEPLTQRFKVISPCATFGDGYVLISAYLLDGDSNDAGSSINISNFRVICVVYGNYLYHATVFTSSGSWRELSINSQMMDLMERMDLVDLIGLAAASLCLYARGIGSQRMDSMGITTTSLYWYTGAKRVVTLDRRTAEITSFVLPGIEDWDRLSMSSLMRVTEGDDGRARIVVSGASGNLKVYERLQDGGWALERDMSIQLPVERSMVASHSKPWELITTCEPLIAVSPYTEGTWRLRLDGETAEVEGVLGVPYPCELPWPPVFHACTCNDGDATK
ncbi:hypothetical protein ACP70R_006579 [Stipagrostis hirtigluma subsp. patula]